jgi:outer membrane protein assembly factor BamB
MSNPVRSQLDRRSTLKVGLLLSSFPRNFLIRTTVSSANRTPSCRSFQYDPQNTGTVTAVSGLVTNVSESYRVDLSHPIRSSPIVAGDSVYTSSTVVDGKAGNVTGVDTREQVQRWRSDWTPGVRSTPTADEESLYVVAPEALVALDRTDGSEQWTVPLPASNFSSPALSNGTLYVGTRNGAVVAIDTTGEQQWESNVGSGAIVNTTPAVGGDRVFVGAENGGVYALSRTGGSQLWNRTFSSPVRAALTHTGQNVLTVTVDGTLVALDPTSGAERWRQSRDVSTASSPAVADDTIYWAAENTLYALSAADGTEQWRFETGGFSGLNNVAPPPIRVGDVVYVTTGHEFVYGVDAQSGTERWRFGPESGNVLSITVVGDTAYVGTDTGTLYVLTGETNTPPEPAIQYLPQEPSVGEQVTFDASNSRDPDGSVTRYDWDIDGDGEYETSGPRVSQTFTSSGTVEVTLRIRDDDGRNVTRQASVMITEGGGATTTETQSSVESGIPVPLDQMPGGIVGAGAAGGSVALGLLYGLSRAMRGDSDVVDEESSTDPSAQTSSTSSSTQSTTETIEFPETSFADYNQGDLIGTGPITRTVEATIDGYDDPVALLSLDASDSSTLDQSLPEQFLEGLRAWKTISDHEYVLTVLDIGSEPVPWAALELADGEFDPLDFVDVSTEQKLSLISQLCEAVHHGHRYGLAHGALSPSNVLVVDDGPSLRIADWEVTGRVLGLPTQDDAYGLSEDLVELGVTQSADIYAIGAVAYTLFTGARVPEEPADWRERLESADAIPEDLESVLLEAMAVGTDRYDTVLHLRDAIKRTV